jgi:taurine transport system substrate-binding protein
MISDYPISRNVSIKAESPMKNATRLMAGGILLAVASQTPAAETIRIGYQNEPDPSHVAIVDGLYEKATGDKIEWRKFDSGASVIAALASNAIDIGYAGSSPLAAGVTRGAPIEAFLLAGLIGKAEGLVVRNGSGINDVKDLVGKKVATPFVSTSHYSLLYVLKHDGVDPTKVNILNLQPPEIAAAFARGDIDAAYVWDPVLSKAKENGKILIDSAEVAKLGGPTFVAWITRKDYASAHPGVLKAFTKVTLDTYAHFRKDPDDYKAGTANAKKIADFNGAKVEEIFDEVDGAYYPLADEQASDALLGKGTADAIAATAAFLKEQKKVDALLPAYSGGITAEFVKAAATPSQ